MFGCVSDTPISAIVQSHLADRDLAAGTTTSKPQRRKGSVFTVEDSSVSSTDVVTYRHFSVDEAADLVYMCDRQVLDETQQITLDHMSIIQPYRPQAGSACWISKDQGALWIRE